MPIRGVNRWRDSLALCTLFPLFRSFGRHAAPFSRTMLAHESPRCPLERGFLLGSRGTRAKWNGRGTSAKCLRLWRREAKGAAEGWQGDERVDRLQADTRDRMHRSVGEPLDLACDRFPTVYAYARCWTPMLGHMIECLLLALPLLLFLSRASAAIWAPGIFGFRGVFG